MKFYENKQGLPYIDVRKQVILMVQPVQNNYEGYTKKQVGKAVMDHKASELLGHTSAYDLEYLVISNNIDDCPIKIHDVKNSHTILGPGLARVRGKPVRYKPYHVTIYYVAISRELLN